MLHSPKINIYVLVFITRRVTKTGISSKFMIYHAKKNTLNQYPKI